MFKVFISKPQNPTLEGYYAIIETPAGKRIRVLDCQLVEPYELHGAFQHDYFPFDTREACRVAAWRKVRRMRGH